MNYNIAGIIQEYPEVHIGVLVGRGMNNKREIRNLAQLQKEAIQRAEQQIGEEPLTKHPYIASWRDAL